ncbi:hypothetical protein GCM10010174_75920 [Kutzneria viridogrisea]|uniref:Uncharacterized protein n=1 Tax=Kutzneria viridogrisea TaxID=47990 RepID=A0ABR6BNB6_9PSEU|nr:hypothetical protein [Kutzneria viridogrisea]
MLLSPALAQAAPAAPATVAACEQIVHDAGYPVGEFTAAACGAGATGDMGVCLGILMNRQVDGDLAWKACLAAST